MKDKMSITLPVLWTATKGSEGYIVAIKDEEFSMKYRGFQIIWADSEEGAVEKYNTRNECSGGLVIGKADWKEGHEPVQTEGEFLIGVEIVSSE